MNGNFDDIDVIRVYVVAPDDDGAGVPPQTPDGLATVLSLVPDSAQGYALAQLDRALPGLVHTDFGEWDGYTLGVVYRMTRAIINHMSAAGGWLVVTFQMQAPGAGALLAPPALPWPPGDSAGVLDAWRKAHPGVPMTLRRSDGTTVEYEPDPPGGAERSGQDVSE